MSKTNEPINGKTKPINIALTKENRDNIDTKTQRDGCTITWIVNRALENYFEKFDINAVIN